MLRKLLRVAAWIVLSLLLFVSSAALAVILWARSDAGRRRILSLIVAEVQPRLSGRLTIGGLEGNLTREVALRAVVVRDADGEIALRVERAVVRYHLWELLRHRFTIAEVRVDGGVARARQLRDGGWNLASLWKGDGGGPSSGGSTVVVRALRGEVALSYGAWRTRLRVDGGSERTGRGSVAWQGRAATHAGGPFTLEAHAWGEDGAGTLVVDDLHADLPGTRARARGTVGFGRGPATVEANAEVRSANLSPLAVLLPGLRGQLDAHAHLVRHEGHFEVDGDVAARELAFGSTRIARLDGDVYLAGRRGAARLRADGVALFAVALDHLRLSGRSEGGGVTLDLDAQGPHDAVARLHATGAPLTATGPLAADLAIGSLVVGARGQRWHATRPGRLRVAPDEVAAELALADDHGAALDATFARRGAALSAELHGRALDARGLAALVRPRLALPSSRIDVDVSTDGATLAAKLHGQTLPWPERNLPALTLAATGRVDKGALDAEGTVDGHAGGHVSLRAHLPVDLQRRAFVRTRALTLDAEARDVDLASLPGALARGRAGVSLHVRGTLRDPVADLRVDGHDLSAQEINHVDLTLHAAYAGRLAQGELAARLHGAPILEAHATADLHGQSWRDAPVRLDATVPSYDLSALPDGAGTIAGEAHVVGTIAHPTGELSLRAAALRLRDFAFARLDARGRFDGDAFAATVDVGGATGGSAHLEARLPLAAEAPLSLALRADHLQLALPAAGPLRALAGTLDGNLAVAGTRAVPELEGRLAIAHGSFGIADDPRRYEELDVDLAAHAGTVTLHRLRVRVGEGWLTAHGKVALVGLQPQSVELVAEAHRFPFQPRNVGAWLDAHAELHGRLVGDVMTGELTLSRGTVELPELSSTRPLQSTAPLPHVVYTDAAGLREARAAERPSRLAAAKAEVIAHIPGPFRIRSPDLTTDLAGQLEVRLDAGVPRVFGHVEAAAGHLELLGRRYEIDHARVVFDGEPGLTPRLDVRITRALARTTVVIELRGTPQDPELELSSDPPIYDTSQVIGTILSGDPESQHIDERSLDRQLVGALSGMLVNRVADQIAPGLPIDVLRVQTGSGGDISRIEAGKYLTERVYVSYVHQLGTPSGLDRVNSNEVALEYRFRQHFRLATRFGDAGIGSIDLVWAIRF